jgi:hypothetical protein
MKPLRFITSMGLAFWLTACATATLHAQEQGPTDVPVCVPIAVGGDGVFFLKPTEACPASAYLSLADAEDTITLGAIRDGTSAYDDYVVVSDMTQIEDKSKELLVLVRPYTFTTELLGLTMVKLLKDGSINGLGTWQNTIPTS